MSHQEPARKIGGQPSSLSSNTSDDSAALLELLYMIDTSSDRELEVNLATIPTGPSDGPTWAQHNFSYLDLPIEPIVKSNDRHAASKTGDAVDEVASVFEDLQNKDTSLTSTVHIKQSEKSNKDVTDQFSSTESELAKLY